MTSRQTAESSASKRGSRFKVNWYRFIPFIGYHHILMILLIISITLLSILIAGCTSESLSDVYLVSLSYANDVQSTNASESPSKASSTVGALAADRVSFEIRAGYFAMCLLVAGQVICSRGQNALEAYVQRTSSGNEVGDPLSIIHAAARFQEEVVFVALLFVCVIFAFFAFLLLGTFPGWHEEADSEGSERDIKPFPSRPVSLVTLALLVVASLLSLLSSFWQHLSSAATSTMASVFTYDNVIGRVGPGAMALGWLSTFFLLVVCVGLLVMIISIRAIARS